MFLIPLGVSADLQSAVKKRPNLFWLCGFAIRIKQDLQTYVVAAAVSSAVSSAASALTGTAALRCSAVILVGIPASTLASITSARSILRTTAVISSGNIEVHVGLALLDRLDHGSIRGR